MRKHTCQLDHRRQKLDFREAHQRSLTEMEELRKFQSSTFDTMAVDVQMQRLVRLEHLAQREIEAGGQPPAVKFHDFLNALASAKMAHNLDLMVLWKWCVLSAGRLSCGCILDERKPRETNILGY